MVLRESPLPLTEGAVTQFCNAHGIQECASQAALVQMGDTSGHVGRSTLILDVGVDNCAARICQAYHAAHRRFHFQAVHFALLVDHVPMPLVRAQLTVLSTHAIYQRGAVIREAERRGWDWDSPDLTDEQIAACWAALEGVPTA